MLSKILALLSPADRRHAMGMLGLMVVGAAMETLGIGLVVPAIALLMQSDPGAEYPALQPILDSLGNPTHMELAVGGMLVLVGVYLVKSAFLVYLAWEQAKFAFGLLSDLSQRLFTTYLRQPYTFHLQRNSAELIRNAITEVNQFTFSGIIPGMLLLTEALVVTGIAVLLLVVEPVGASIVIAVLGTASALFYVLTRRRIRQWGATRQHHEGLRIQHLQQGLGGAKDVKILGRETDFLEQYRLHNTMAAAVGKKQQAIQQLPRLGLELLAVIGLALLVITMLVQGRAMGSIVPSLGLFAAAAFRMMPSVNRIVTSAQQLRYGLPVIETLEQELDVDLPEPLPGPDRPLRFERTIELVDVQFTYPAASTPALQSVALRVERGESVGFVGASGSGKSTLIDVILGLLKPDCGDVRVDGLDIQLRLRQWQDQIGYVPQSIFLTDDTLRRNIAFGLAAEQIDEASVMKAVRAAQLEELVNSLEHGLDAIVGERGIRLSGGQRQRIGIARALYHDPAVLVLDEATSSLDTGTERGVMEAVNALHGKKTILIVTHRLTTVADCDRIFHLAAGRLVRVSTPDALPAATGAEPQRP